MQQQIQFYPINFFDHTNTVLSDQNSNDFTYNCDKFKKKLIYRKYLSILMNEQKKQNVENMNDEGQKQQNNKNNKIVLSNTINKKSIKNLSISDLAKLSSSNVDQNWIEQSLSQLINDIQFWIKRYIQMVEIQKKISMFLPKQHTLNNSYFNTQTQAVFDQRKVTKKASNNLIQSQKGIQIKKQQKQFNIDDYLIDQNSDIMKKVICKAVINSMCTKKKDKKDKKNTMILSELGSITGSKLIQLILNDDDDKEFVITKEVSNSSQSEDDYEKELIKIKQKKQYNLNLSKQFFQQISFLKLTNAQQLIQFIFSSQNVSSILLLIKIILDKGSDWSNKKQNNCFLKIFLLLQNAQKNNKSNYKSSDNSQNDSRFNGLQQFKSYFWLQLKRQFPKRINYTQYDINKQMKLQQINKKCVEFSKFLSFITHIAKVSCEYVPRQFILMVVMKIVLYLYKYIQVSQMNNLSLSVHQHIIQTKLLYQQYLQSIFQHLHQQLIQLFDFHLLQQLNDPELHRSSQQAIHEIIITIYQFQQQKSYVKKIEDFQKLQNLVLKKYISMISCGKFIGVLVKNGMRYWRQNDKKNLKQKNKCEYVNKFVKRYVRDKDQKMYQEVIKSIARKQQDIKNNTNNNNQEKKNKKKNKKKKSRHH